MNTPDLSKISQRQPNTPGKLRVAMMLMCAGPAAWAQDDVQTVDAIVVQGQRAETKALAGSTVVDVINSEKIQESGAVDLNQALERLIPSFRWPQSANSGNNNSATKSANLRGVGPQFTLVLVNGKRRHVSAQLGGVPGFQSDQYVDINQIPLNAIERIEVLRDGTATRYGGDAVAGAINIILKAANEGGQISSRLAQTSRGDGLSRWVGGTVGTRLGEDGGFLTLSGDYLSQDPYNRAGPNQNQVIDGRPWNLNRDAWGDSRIRGGHAILNGELPVTGSLSAYLVGTFGSGTGDSSSQPARYWKDSNLIERYPDGFQPWTSVKTRDSQLDAGLRWGDDRIGRFDFGLGYGYNQAKNYTYNSVAVSYGEHSQDSFYRGSLNASEANVKLDWEKDFAVGLVKPLTLSAGAAYRKEKWWSKLGDEQSWNQGPIKFTTDPRTGALRPTPNGNDAQKGLLPDDIVSLSRNVAGVYLGADAQITQALNLSGVARFEDYSDVGSAVTGQLAARYDFTPVVALRGSAGTAYKAPSLALVGLPSSSLNTSTGLYTRRLRPDDPRARALGATELEPTESTNFGLGLVLQPTTRTSLTIDAYQIKLRGAVVTGASLTGPAVQALLRAEGDTESSAVSFFTNGADTTTRGIDISGRWQPELTPGWGDLNLTLGWGYTRTKVDRIKVNPLAPNADNTSLIYTLEDGQPRSKLIIGADYRLRDWSLSTTILRYGSNKWYRAPTAQLVEPTNLLTYSPAWIVNLRVGYDFSKQLSFAVGANNVFDKLPEKSPFPNSGLDQYSHYPAYGSAGALYYITLDYKF